MSDAPRGDTAASGLRVVLKVLTVGFVVAYPVVVFFGLGRWSPRTLGLAIAGLVSLSVALRLPLLPPSERWAIVRVPVVVAALSLLAGLLEVPLLLLGLPAIVNAVLLASFASTLHPRAPMSMVERFARLGGAELDADGVGYCRLWTGVWCVFFALNAALCAALVWGPLAWWTLWTGALSYGAAGVLFAVERLTRIVHHRRRTAS